MKPFYVQEPTKMRKSTNTTVYVMHHARGYTLKFAENKKQCHQKSNKWLIGRFVWHFVVWFPYHTIKNVVISRTNIHLSKYLSHATPSHGFVCEMYFMKNILDSISHAKLCSVIHRQFWTIKIEPSKFVWFAFRPEKLTHTKMTYFQCLLSNNNEKKK